MFKNDRANVRSAPAKSLAAEDPAERLTLFRGRGALSNTGGRFEAQSHHAFDDGWGETPPPAQMPTVVAERETVRTIIARNDSPDIGFDRSINAYRGCEHGCVYCFARPSHAYWGLSPGLDFETRLTAKIGAAAALRRELAHKAYRPQFIAMGTNTDPYQPIERRFRVTREVLELLWECRHPAGIVTKSALVQRDLDLLAPMAALRLMRVGISVTTLDPGLARRMEPRAAAPHRRLETIAALAKAGVPVTVLAAPMIPGLNDQELETILEAARDAGAQYAGYILLRLPYEIKDLFREWLSAHAPDRAKKVMNLLRSTRGGADYDAEWGKRMKGEGVYAQLLGDRFRRAARRLGFSEAKPEFDLSLFRRPKTVEAARQGDLWADECELES